MATIIMRQLVRCFSKRNSNFINPNNTTTTYMEAMYSAWLRDPTSVHKSWDTYFRNCPNFADDETELATSSIFKARKFMAESRTATDKAIDDHAAVYELIRKYQGKGHSVAHLDPLETNVSHYPAKELHEELNFLPHDWDREFRLPATTLIGGKVHVMILKEIIRRLEKIYCRRIGIEYIFLDSTEQRNWIRDRFEEDDKLHLVPDEQRKMLTCLSRAVGFEKFLCSRFPEHKNASLTGCEILIPALKTLIDISCDKGVNSFILGLPQRGRLNILANVCKKSLKEILALFNEVESGVPDDLGDLKYSLGTVVERLNWTTNKEIRIVVVANPMHLEAFVPVVLGKTRAEQFQRGDHSGTEVMPILIHDDAALYAQGIAYEALQLSTMPNYTTHGAINVVINTSNGQYPPTNSSSSQYKTPNPSVSQYCKNISRALDAPIFHVNADDPDAAMYICKIAAEWRAQFHKDVIIQLVGYRRPEDCCDVFADPTTCYKVREHLPCLEKYANKLVAENVIAANDAKTEMVNFEDVFRTSLELAKLMPFDGALWRDTLRAPPENCPQIKTTGVKIETLMEIGRNFLLPPKNDPNFVLSKAFYRILVERQEMLDNGTADWTLAEALAFGTLLKQGVHVRLSVQASERDAYSQRHHLLHHQLIPGKTYNALEDVYPKQAPYVISYNSLSENAVLGFEHGYSMANPNALVVWEAPIGDLASSAQSIIDQYIATGQSKWGQQSGLVMLLPHGLVGMGPEQSSARLERFLQMCSDDPYNFPQNDLECQLQDINWIVANCSTPANYFHILRRQIALPFQKPLVLMLPKVLVEHGEIKSNLSEMGKHSQFQPIISDDIPEECNPANYKKLIFCSGGVYYDLVKARAEKKLEEEIAIVRVEQIAPFPFELVKSQIDSFENADLVWVQEEHKNQGAWSYVQPRFQTIISDTRDMIYIGRPCSSLAASISKSQYNRQLKEIMEESMLIDLMRYW